MGLFVVVVFVCVCSAKEVRNVIDLLNAVSQCASVRAYYDYTALSLSLSICMLCVCGCVCGLVLDIGRRYRPLAGEQRVMHPLRADRDHPGGSQLHHSLRGHRVHAAACLAG